MCYAILKATQNDNVKEWISMGLFGKRKSKIEIVGVYTVRRSPNVKLIECIIDCPPSHVDIDKFIHPVNNMPKSNWQAAYDEHYLNEKGTEVIGRFCELPTDTSSTRLAFFFTLCEPGQSASITIWETSVACGITHAG